MKIVTASDKKQSVKISRSEWESIGKRAGWLKTAAPLRELSDAATDSFVHPLDRKDKGRFAGVDIPEENYYRSVWAKLVDIVANSRRVSEKSFGPREAIHKEIDSLLRNAEVMKVVDLCESEKKRADYCAELLFDKKANAVFSEKMKQGQ